MVQSSQKKSYKLPIAIMFMLFFMIAFVTGYQNPLGTVIKELSGGNAIMTQLGTLCNFMAYAVMGLPAGILLQKKGYRITALSAVSVGFLGVLITYLSGFIESNITAVSIYMVGAFVAGFSMCMLNTVVNPMLNSLGSTPNKGNQLVQFGGTLNSLGATLAPMIVGGLIGGAASSISSANPVFFLAMGIFALAFCVIYFSKLPEDPDLGKPQQKIKMSGALKYHNFAFGLVAIFAYIGVEVGIANWGLQYLTESELVQQNNDAVDSSAIAGTVVAIYWLLMLIGRLIGGSIGAKVSSRVMLSFTSALAIVFILLGINLPENVMPFIGFDAKTFSFSIVQIPFNAIFFVLVGLCTSIQWGAIFNLAVTGLGKYTAVASGLFMVMVCGGGILPSLQSLIAEHNLLASFYLPVALSAYLFIYAIFLSRPNRPEVMEHLVEE